MDIVVSDLSEPATTDVLVAELDLHGLPVRILFYNASYGKSSRFSKQAGR